MDAPPKGSRPQDSTRLARNGYPSLVPNSAKEAMIIQLFEHFGSRFTAGRVASYREDLADVELAELQRACKRWRTEQPPRKTAPTSGELLELIGGTLERQGSREPQPWQITEDRPRRNLDEVFTELAAEHPDNPLFREILARRTRARAQGVELTEPMVARGLVEGVQGRLSDMPAAGERSPGGEG